MVEAIAWRWARGTEEDLGELVAAFTPSASLSFITPRRSGSGVVVG